MRAEGLVPEGRIASLTGVRFLAAAAVFGGHLVWLDPEHLRHPGEGLPLFNQQATGVGLFFALSGVVLTWTYGERFAAGQGTPRRFLWRRFARIYPMYLVGVLLAIPWGVHDGDAPRWLVGQLVGVQSWFANKGSYYGWHGAAWSVSVEAFFYLCFPLLAVGLLRRITTPGRAALAWTVGWALLVTAHLVGQQRGASGVTYWLYIFPPLRTVEFVLGMLVGWAAVQGWGRDLAVRLSWAPLVLALSTLVLFGPTRWPLVYALWFVPMFSATLLVLASGAGPRVLSHRWMEQLGEASYSFYLLHFLVLLVVGIALRVAGVHGNALLVAGAPVALIAAVAASVVAHRLVERPAQRLLTASASPAA